MDERGFNADQTPHCMCQSIFNHFRDIAIYRWRVTGFQQFSWVNERFYHIFLSPGYAPGTIAVNITRLERWFNACKTPRCIYPSYFNRFWDIASYWSKIATFSYPTSVKRPRRVWARRNFAKILIYTKLEWMGYRAVKKAWQYVQPFWYNTSVWRTDGRTDVQPIAITCFNIADAHKNQIYNTVYYSDRSQERVNSVKCICKH